ncbi:papain-like cysteine protease family protein [Lentilactobacillus kosonis]|uniref:Peptidase C39-like domain-containing protein n=1 Tax=Lentilactobacillus kosonis TaxID=2810561 RepID=A0A401FNB1_9LACO|nr:papain-like cysteine protease family protein [Lentilactobacillus kosonis]GAY73833.1 hypothetical protein NBRC111893_1979 [Lentilactobacillus kosonis]
MRKISIANERPNPFYVRLKPVAGDYWYIKDLDDATDKSNRKVSFPDNLIGQDLLIDEISFFNKRAWYKFTIDNISGWILKRSVKANYRRLAIAPLIQATQSDVDNQVTALVMLLTSAQGTPDSDTILEAVKQWNDVSTDLIDLKSLIISQTNSIKDLRKVNFRQLQKHLMRRKPVLLRVAGMNNLKNSFILLVGFNKHTIYYNDPWTGRLEAISAGHLKKHLYNNTVDAISY